MKKKIIFAVIIIVVILGIGIYLYQNKDNNITNDSNNITTNNIKISESDDKDWSEYKTYDITLESESVKITDEGIYNITGSLIDNNIEIETDGNVKLIFNNVTIKNSKGSAINVINAKNVYIEVLGDNTLEGTVNEEIDAAIYSKDDLFFEGTGVLNITSNMDAIGGSDDITFYSGTYNIASSDEGIKGKDSVTIIDGIFNIKSNGDAIKTTNEEEKGYIVIKNGTINIESKCDGITSSGDLQIENGSFNIKTGDGAKQTTKIGFESNLSKNNESLKGLKADKNIMINGGTFNINTEDDSIHSNSDIIITKGEFTLSSSEDGIHADGLVEINNGTFSIISSEGIEATYIKINNGNININASDDGINAGNKSSDYSIKVEINGGNLTIKMGQGDTDGIDSNGDVVINGGTINVTGNSTFDYDGIGTVNGGTVICNGEKVTTLPNQIMGGGQVPNDNQNPRDMKRW